GFVSVAAAERVYGVVVRDGKLDEASTASLRARRAGAAGDLPEPARAAGAVFDLGPERQELEARWTPEIQDAVNQAVWACPPGLRIVVREELLEEVGRRMDRGELLGPGSIPEIAGELAASMRRLLYR
ncbi:MAG: hypothetical protein ACRDYD_09325, partial [Acidimicrobiales bacterium]